MLRKLSFPVKCPRCGLFNPESAQRCDCGFDFESRTVKESYLTQATLVVRKDLRPFVAICSSIGVIGLLLTYSGEHGWPPVGHEGALFFSGVVLLGGGGASLLGAVFAILDAKSRAWSPSGLGVVVTSLAVLGGYVVLAMM
jgi:hypothetical protein